MIVALPNPSLTCYALDEAEMLLFLFKCFCSHQSRWSGDTVLNLAPCGGNISPLVLNIQMLACDLFKDNTLSTNATSRDRHLQDKVFVSSSDLVWGFKGGPVGLLRPETTTASHIFTCGTNKHVKQETYAAVRSHGACQMRAGHCFFFLF